MAPSRLALVLLLALAGPAGAAADSTSAPTIELYTIGPGANVFSHYGHTALCVVDERSPEGRCFNFGTADLSAPLALAWDTLRGSGKFWVGEVPRLTLLQAYELEDRTIWRQRLPLPQADAEALARTLDGLSGEAGAYRYHPYFDNCTTRVRDLVDGASGGKLSAGADAADGSTFRAHSEAGFAGRPLLLAAQLVALGSAGERRTTTWEAMFLPLVLRDEVERRLGVPATVLYQRRSPVFPASTAVGGGLLVALGLALAGLLLSLARRPGAKRRLALLALALTTGGAGACLWAVVLASSFPELSGNAALFVLLPVELCLPLLPDRWLPRFALLRLSGVAVVLLLSAAGLVLQPVLAVGTLVALPSAALWLVTRPQRVAPAPEPAGDATPA